MLDLNDKAECLFLTPGALQFADPSSLGSRRYS